MAACIPVPWVGVLPAEGSQAKEEESEPVWKRLVLGKSSSQNLTSSHFPAQLVGVVQTGLFIMIHPTETEPQVLVDLQQTPLP